MATPAKRRVGLGCNVELAFADADKRQSVRHAETFYSASAEEIEYE